MIEVQTQTEDPAAVREALLGAWDRLGVEAIEQTMADIPFPPIKMPVQRTVSLRTFVVSLVLLAAVLIGALSSFFLFFFKDDEHVLGTTESRSEDYCDKIALIDQFFSQYSLYDTDGQLLLDAMLKAYASATGDRYAAYYTDEEFSALMADNAAEMVGVGIVVVEDVESCGLRIVAVSPDSPAQAAGVLANDLLISAGEGEASVTYRDDGYDLLVRALRGEAGTQAVFTVVREGEEILVHATRAKVETVSVTAQVSVADPTIGILRISQFDLSTPRQFEKEMEALIAAGCTSFVYDLRNNPGGDSRSVCAVLSYFLNRGDLVYSTVHKDKTVERTSIVPVTYSGDYESCSILQEKIGKYRAYKKVVLVNGSSASAAELFTAVLRDYSLATIVGENTFGKGVIQSIFSLQPYGFSGGLKLTIGYYTPPCDVNYDGAGIAPDIIVTQPEELKKKNPYTLTEEEDTQLAAAVSACKS